MIGFVNLYKERGFTSFKNIKILSKILNNAKVGHSGTLDPIAEGVLPVCLNEATKLASYVMAEDKDYVAGLTLGYKTDSYDVTGNIIAEGSRKVPDISEIKSVLKSLEGEIEIDIPAYSAININGERAYKLARKGIIENAGTRKSRIYAIKVVDYSYPELKIALSVEKGTYVRSIINRIGDILGTFAVMNSLVRTKSGLFSIDSAFKTEEIMEMVAKKNYGFLIPVTSVLRWSRVIVKKEFEQLVRNGVSIKLINYKYIPEDPTEMVFVTTVEGEILSIAERYQGDIPFKNVRVFNNREFKITE